MKKVAPDVHPKGSPKYNLKKDALGVKRTPPTNKKNKYPKGKLDNCNHL